jgi:multisubunit Na+/H+ antiporter MnhB subunit
LEEENEKSSKTKKWLIAIIVILLIIVAIFITRAIINHNNVQDDFHTLYHFHFVLHDLNLLSVGTLDVVDTYLLLNVFIK